MAKDLVTRGRRSKAEVLWLSLFTEQLALSLVEGSRSIEKPAQAGMLDEFVSGFE
jgi:hypothetical protein